MEESRPSPMAGEQTSSLKKRAAMACTTCRQVKLRCDATKQFPGPCTRCKKHRKACLFDAGFKRSPTRGALERVIEEREQLRRLVHSIREDPTTAIAATSSASISGTPLDASHYSLLDETSYSGPSEGESPASSTATAYALFDLPFDTQVIHDLFKHFCDHYLLHLPILDIQRSPHSVRNTSPLLFWAVVITACREHPTYAGYFDRLIPPFKRLLGEHLVESIRSIHTIQALLLLCTWPFPVRRQAFDPCWAHCGQAVAATLEMGLEKALPTWVAIAGDMSGADVILRFKTWMGCFVVSTSLAADLGLPPPMSLVAHLEPLARQRLAGHVPESFLLRAEIQHCSIRAVTLLNNQPSSSLQNSLIDLLEQDLDKIGGRLPESTPPSVRVDLLATKLRLFAVSLLTRKSEEEAAIDAISRAVWYKGFHVALQLVEIFYETVEQRKTSEAAVTSASPKHYFRILVTAGLYLLKIIAIDPDISSQDKILARNRIKQVHEILLKGSNSEIHEHARAAAMIALMSKHAEDQNSVPYFKEESTGVAPSILVNGLEIHGNIRHLNATNVSPGKEPDTSRDASDPPDAMPMMEGLSFQDGWVPPLGDDWANAWDSWPLDADELMDVLRTQPDNFPM